MYIYVNIKHNFCNFKVIDILKIRRNRNTVLYMILEYHRQVHIKVTYYVQKVSISLHSNFNKSHVKMNKLCRHNYLATLLTQINYIEP